jgi:hypothetical protein
VEDEGVLAAGGPRQLRHPRREAAAGEVVRPRDVRLVAPLIVPSVSDPFPKITRRGQKSKFRPPISKSARRRAAQHRRRPAGIPDVDDGDAGIAARHRHQLRRRHVRHAPRHPRSPPLAVRRLRRRFCSGEESEKSGPRTLVFFEESEKRKGW